MDSEYQVNKLIRSIKLILRIIIALSVVFAVFVYTPEYNGDQSHTGIKEFLNYKWTINFPVSRIMTLLIVLITVYGILFLVTRYLEEINRLKHYNIQSQKENQQLAIKLSQINSKLFSHTNNDILKAMETFAINNIDVISVQLYQYKIIKIKAYIRYEVIPTNMYYARNGSYTNQIFEQYDVPERLLKQYDRAKKEYFKGNYTALEKLISKLTNELKKLDLDSSVLIKESDSIKYAVLILSLQLNFGQDNLTFEELSTRIQLRLASIKRTGFLRSIIEDTFYKFQHEGDSGKGKRIYFTKCFPIENIPHLFVITLNPNVSKNKDSNQVINNIGKKFYDILSKDLKVVYNDYIG